MSLIHFKNKELSSLSFQLKKEFLEANAVGAYSSSTISFCNTRKYHGLLVVRQPQISTDNYVLLSDLDETILMNGAKYELGTNQYPGVVQPQGYKGISEFKLNTIPTWMYKFPGAQFKKELLLVEDKNQVLIRYTLVKGQAIDLKLDPKTSFRRIHDIGKERVCNKDYENIDNGIAFRMHDDFSNLNLQFSKQIDFKQDPLWFYNTQYLVERDRGYDFEEDLFRLGQFSISLKEGESFVFSASTKEEVASGLAVLFKKEKKEKRVLNSLENALDRAADQFVSTTERGTEVCAGFHWFGRWGRDTFIALPGLTLARGKVKLCEKVIDTMLQDLEGGLLTNIGVGNVKEYNSVDASLWFFWTLCELANATKNKIAIWSRYGEKMKEILTAYRDGTMYNIHSKENGLLHCGEEGVALTWMDAKVDGEAVTPRRGCPVEINALWFNAIQFSLECAEEVKDDSFIKEWKPLAKKLKVNFVKEFWNEKKGYLADVVGDDYKDFSIRPNQLFSISLPYPLIKGVKAKSILKLVKEHLFCLHGMRTLAPKDIRYVNKYEGGQKERDKSYHQGIVWPWLLGAYCEANLKVNGVRFIAQFQKINDNFARELKNDGLGSVSELYNPEAPFEGVGTISQAWSVSELLRINKLIKKYKRTNNK